MKFHNKPIKLYPSSRRVVQEFEGRWAKRALSGARPHGLQAVSGSFKVQPEGWFHDDGLGLQDDDDDDDSRF